MPSAVADAIVAGEGSRSLLFLHGIGGGAWLWQAQVEYFAAVGYRVLAWDMPGYGASASIDPYDFPGLARAALDLLDAHGIARAVLVGQSMGGMLALEIHSAAPRRVEGLVLAATSPAFGSQNGEFQRRFIAARLAPLEAGLGMQGVAHVLMPGFLAAAASPELRSVVAEGMAAIPAETYRRAVRALIHFDRRERLAQIRVPVLCVAGSADQIAGPKTMRQLAAAIPHAVYAELAGCGHLPNMERPLEFNELIAQFLHEQFSA
ncbi:MAG: alpha/beta fold hydrolase [Rhodocyclaceae bacterium]|nr:alpha/beta fold hydrolase [Rhodocyclaceae bacterium]MBX3668575.1 alpha/beta fold hydrolase [Rhodocyclaceae bacterium]